MKEYMIVQWGNIMNTTTLRRALEKAEEDNGRSHIQVHAVVNVNEGYVQLEAPLGHPIGRGRKE